MSAAMQKGTFLKLVGSMPGDERGEWKEGGLLPLEASRAMVNAFAYVGKAGFGMVIGAEGSGKTTAARFFQEHRGAAYIEARPAELETPFQMLQRIGGELGVSGPTRVRLAKAIAAKMRDTGRLLIVDQADELPLPILKVLWWLHDPHPQEGIHGTAAVCLLGMPVLDERVRRNRNIARRIRYVYRVPPMPDTELAQMMPGAAEEVLRAVSSWSENLPGWAFLALDNLTDAMEQNGWKWGEMSERVPKRGRGTKSRVEWQLETLAKVA